MSLEDRMVAMHQKASRLGLICYMRSGCVPRALIRIIEGTKSLEALKQYNPDEPRIPAGCPEGGQWCYGSAIKTVGQAEDFVALHKGKYVGNSSQCASLTHALAPKVPPASAWKRGVKVEGNDIPVGTPIATFNHEYDGTYHYGPKDAVGGKHGVSHTDIYLGQSKEGVRILHQWPGSKGVQITTIPWNDWNGPDEAGVNYYTIAK